MCPGLVCLILSKCGQYFTFSWQTGLVGLREGARGYRFSMPPNVLSSISSVLFHEFWDADSFGSQSGAPAASGPGSTYT